MTDSLRLWAAWIGSLSSVPRFAVWALVILLVAVILGGLWAVIDQVFSYGLPNVKKALDAPVIIRIAKPVRPFSEPAPKGFARIPTTVVDIADGRRRQALSAAYHGGSRRVH